MHTSPLTADIVLENVKEVSAKFAAERAERQRRRELHKSDFDLLAEAGFPLIAVPRTRAGSTRM